jgi:hypothetical protein
MVRRPDLDDLVGELVAVGEGYLFEYGQQRPA